MHQLVDQAERHVRESKERIARQLAYIRELENHRDLPAAEQAKRRLESLRHNHELACHDLAHTQR